MKDPHPDHPSDLDVALEASHLLTARWNLPIVRALLDGPKGFNELQRALGAVGTTTLSSRLDALERAEVLRRLVQSEVPPRTRYELTPVGQDLRLVIDKMRSCQPPTTITQADGTVIHNDRTEIMALLQEKWVLQVLLSLSAEPRGFTALTRLLGVNTTTLTERLATLERAGLIENSRTSSFPPRGSYAITPAAEPFRGVLQSIVSWSNGCVALTGITAD